MFAKSMTKSVKLCNWRLINSDYFLLFLTIDKWLIVSGRTLFHLLFLQHDLKLIRLPIHRKFESSTIVVKMGGD